MVLGGLARSLHSSLAYHFARRAGTEINEKSMNHDQTDSHLFDLGLNDMLPAVVSCVGNIRSISTNDRAVEQDRKSVRV